MCVHRHVVWRDWKKTDGFFFISLLYSIIDNIFKPYIILIYYITVCRRINYFIVFGLIWLSLNYYSRWYIFPHLYWWHIIIKTIWRINQSFCHKQSVCSLFTFHELIESTLCVIFYIKWNSWVCLKIWHDKHDKKNYLIFIF